MSHFQFTEEDLEPFAECFAQIELLEEGFNVADMPLHFPKRQRRFKRLTRFCIASTLGIGLIVTSGSMWTSVAQRQTTSPQLATIQFADTYTGSYTYDVVANY